MAKVAEKKGKSADVWTDVETGGGFWAEGIQGWEKGKVLVGRLMKLRNIGTEDKPNFVADMVTENGRETWGAPTVLKNALDSMKRGTVIRVGCLGKIALTGEREMWDFKVQMRAAKPGELADPGPADSEAADDDDLPF